MGPEARKSATTARDRNKFGQGRACFDFWHTARYNAGMTASINTEIFSILSRGVVLGFWAGLSPGPLHTLVLAQSMRHGTREGVKVALVPFLTDLPTVVVCAVLLQRLSNYGPVLGTVSLVGTLFLLWLAWDSFSVRSLETATPEASPRSLQRGMLVNYLNPNVYVFWLTVGGPLTVAAWKVTPLAAAGFILCLLGCLVGCKITLAVIVGRSRHLLVGRGYLVVMRMLGVLLAVFALLMLRDGLRQLGVWPQA